MSEKDSQSIKSDRISESTIARIAGNLLSSNAQDWIRGGGSNRQHAVVQAVATARAIAAEVRNSSTPKEQP